MADDQTFVLLDEGDFQPAGDLYPDLRGEVERVLAKEAADLLARPQVSQPDERGFVRVFLPYADS